MEFCGASAAFRFAGGMNPAIQLDPANLYALSEAGNRVLA